MTDNTYERFGIVNDIKPMQMTGKTGSAMGDVAAVWRFSTGNLSNNTVTNSKLNLNMVEQASDPNVRAYIQAMVQPKMRIDANGNIVVQSSRLTSASGIRDTLDSKGVPRGTLDHQGIDINRDSGGYGEPFRSTVKGTVDSVTYGGISRITIKADDGTYHDFLHGNNYAVRQGDSVSVGDVLGNISDVGSKPSPHVHYQIRASASFTDTIDISDYAARNPLNGLAQQTLALPGSAGSISLTVGQINLTTVGGQTFGFDLNSTNVSNLRFEAATGEFSLSMGGGLIVRIDTSSTNNVGGRVVLPSGESVPFARNALSTYSDGSLVISDGQGNLRSFRPGVDSSTGQHLWIDQVITRQQGIDAFVGESLPINNYPPNPETFPNGSTYWFGAEAPSSARALNASYSTKMLDDVEYEVHPNGALFRNLPSGYVEWRDPVTGDGGITNRLGQPLMVLTPEDRVSLSDDSLGFSLGSHIALKPLQNGQVEIRSISDAQTVVFIGDFECSVNADIAASKLNLTQVATINGQNLSANAYAIDPQDLVAYGFTFSNIISGTIPKSGQDLIAAIDPTVAANNYTPPELTVTNLPGNLIQRSLELGNGTTLSSIRTASGQLVTTTETTRGGDGSFVTVVKDSEGQLLSNISTQYIYDQTNVSRIETVTTFSGTVRQVFDDNGNLASSAPVQSGSNNLIQTLSTATDFLSLVRAIQTGQPLPILASGLRLANAFNGGVNLELSGSANVASGFLSLLSLNAALDRGDTFGAITAGSQALSFGAQAYISFGGTAGFATEINTFLNGSGATNALGLTDGVVPYLNLVNSIINGDPVGTVAGVLMLFPATAPFGIALSIANTIFSLFDEPDNPYIPPPYGTGRFAWNGAGADTSIKTEATGERGGDQAVTNVMTNVLATLNAVIERERQQNPGSALGLIANRMPGVSYDGTGYSYTDINPLTGEQKNPQLRFDTSGRPYNATPGSPESFQSITEGIVRSALARGAIAPLWEVQTAKLQNDAGDPKAGLTEEERAGRDGQLAAPLAATATTQAFRPVMLDLNGNGLQTTTKAAGVAFDVDDSGYLKQTAWLRGDDGFLVIDRNLNGSIDSGKELFANGTVALGRRGLAGMVWADSNYDGKLSPSDPMWAELKVWQDLNQNGVREAGEARTLTAQGITELNYAMGTFTQVNAATGEVSVKQLASPDLVADKDGTRTTVVPEGILVQKSRDGQISLLVSRVDDRTALEANRDGITGFEDIETIVNSRDLLANDTLGGFAGSNLTLTSVSNFKHGTGFLDANGFVHFSPTANYSGAAAGFDYGVRAINGQIATATVDVNVQNINDAPTLANVEHVTKPVYGYSPPFDNDFGSYPGGPIYEPTSYAAGYDEDGNYYAAYTTPVVANEDTGAGRVVGTDIESTALSLRYTLINAPQYGGVSLNADGTFQYTSWKQPGIASDRVTYGGNGFGGFGRPVQYGTIEGYYGDNLPPGGVNPTTDVFQVRITDPQGASSIQSITVQHFGPYLAQVPTGSGGGGKKPISVDLTGDGFKFTNVNDSNIFFDVNGDGRKHRTAWINKDDGLLAYDIDGDGKIDKAGEISFARYKDGAQTDLEGLRAFDTNGDGMFSALDAKWGKFGIWQDVNENGVTDAGEFKTLTQLGVASVGLTSNGQFEVINGQTVHGVGSITMLDGTTRAMADITLAYAGEVQMQQAGGTTTTTTPSPFSPSGEVLDGTASKDLILGKNGNNIVNGYAGDDVISEGSGNDVIDGGDGNDLIYSGADNDMVLGGKGDDTIYAGLGNDVVFGGDGNDAIFADGGNDVVFGGAGNDLIAGGAGNDVLSGDAGDDELYGESGNDALFGRDGNDKLFGMDGADRLDGGKGDDTLDGGAGADDMLGGAGNDIYVVDNAQDKVTELGANGLVEGFDTVRTALNGYTLTANVEKLVLTGAANLAGSGNELNNQLYGNSGNNTLSGGAGNDVLDGSYGADTLIGGTGDDTYIVDNTLDVVAEAANEGIDLVKASVSYALAANVENLTLTGTRAINGTGNALANVMQGNSASNTLDGGAGNDTYVLQRGGGRDTVVDASGTDSVLVKGNLTAADISLTRRDLDVVVGIKNTSGATTDSLLLKNWFSGTFGQVSSGAIEIIRFENGTPGFDDAYIRLLLDNRAPTAVGDAGAAQEDTQVNATGNVLTNDTDPDLTYDSRQYLSVANAGMYSGVYGSLALAANGSHTYTLNDNAANVQALGRNALVTDVFSYTVQDNALENKTATAALTISIKGTNDGPQAFVDVAAVKEDSTFTAMGNVLTNDKDVDFGDTLTVAAPSTLTGTYGNLTLNAKGGYSYALHNSALNVQSLRGGQQVIDSFAYTATDGLATSASNLAVTVTGTNDAPVAFADAATVKEDVTVLATGNVLANDKDLDVGDTLRVASASVGTFVGTYGSLTLAANGSYSYALNSSAANVQTLGRNAVVTDTFAYTAQDDGDTQLQGTSALTVTITGSNDGPQAVVDVAAVKEDGTLTATGNVLTNDKDVDVGDVLTVASPGALTGTYGNLTLNANGSYSYALNNSALNVQSLRGGQQVVDSFAYSATDGLATSASSLNVTVTGTNDAPVAFADTAAVKEDTTLTVTGNVLANDKDVDQGTVLSVATAGSFTSQYGTLVIAANGGYTYTLNNSAAGVQKLGVGQSVTDVFAYTVKDNDINTLTATANLSVTIAGTNDAPIVASAIATQAARENRAFTYIVPVATFTDFDTGDALTYSARAVDALGNFQALPTWLSFNATTRAFTGTPGSTAGGSFDFVVTAADRAGATAASRFTLNISDEFAGTGASANVITGNNFNSVLNGTSLNETIIGKAGSDTLYGGAGDDVLDGGTGADLLFGDAGNDTIKLSIDALWGNNSKVVNMGSAGNAGNGQQINIGWMNRSLDTFDGGAGIDTLLGTSGADVIALDDGNQRIKNIEIIDAGAGDDIVDLTSNIYALGNMTVYGGDGNDVIWSSSGNDVLYGGSGDDLLNGGAGNDTLDGGTGNDILTGASGNDTLRDLTGNNAFLGGVGNDTIEAGGGNDFIAAGKGDDIIRAGGGNNVVAMNAGDGRDTVFAAAGARNTLSLGVGVALQDLTFKRAGQDLQMGLGRNDQLTLKDWYVSDTNRNFVTLQMIDPTHGNDYWSRTFNKNVESFNFKALVSKFDVAVAASPGLSQWSLMNGLLDTHLASSNNSALGGELAAGYAIDPLLAVGVCAAQAVLGSTKMGSQTQSVGPQFNGSVQSYRIG